MSGFHIQRGTIQRPLRNAGTRLSDAVSLDYMGSTEFEFGALPRSLRTLLTRMDKIQLTIDPRIQDEGGATCSWSPSTKAPVALSPRNLRVLHTFTPDEYEKYLVLLLAMRDGTRHTKESTHFNKDHAKHFKTLKCDFWWDIDAHVMWSFDKPFMNRLGDHLVASWKYMDEEKRKRDVKQG